jgi:hypothetical protein
MPVVNLLGNLLTPGYSTLYLVHSPELEEAELRGARIDSVFGKVNEVDESWYADPVNRCFIAERDEGDAKTLPTLQLKDTNRTGDHPVGEYYRLSYKDSPLREEGSGISPPKYLLFNTFRPPYHGPKHSGALRFVWWSFIALFLGVIPYAFIGSLTRFHPAQYKSSTYIYYALACIWNFHRCYYSVL